MLSIQGGVTNGISMAPIVSILDNDAYKLAMQQAIFLKYPDVKVEYKFNNRAKDVHKFNKEGFELLKIWISELPLIQLTNDELVWLKEKCTWFTSSYLDFLASFSFDPAKEVILSFDPEKGYIDLLITGVWKNVILYEVVLMSLISEAYFTCVDKDWTYDGQDELAREKCRRLVRSGCFFSEFGTRRRRTFKNHDIVVRVLADEHRKIQKSREEQEEILKGRGETEEIKRAREVYKNIGTGKLVGTSNIYLAKKYGIDPVGTLAHEWFMAMSVLARVDGKLNLETVNQNALAEWLEVYPDRFHVALTDTYTSKLFFKSVRGDLAWKFNLRQDSGEPLQWITMFLEWYNELFKPSLPEKTLVFSDSLDVNTCEKIQLAVEKANNELNGKPDGPIKAAYGVGTFFSNDFQKKSKPTEKSKAMNMVIKLHRCQGIYVVKLSDNPGKHQGEFQAITEVEDQLRTLFGNHKKRSIWKSKLPVLSKIPFYISPNS